MSNPIIDTIVQAVATALDIKADNSRNKIMVWINRLFYMAIVLVIFAAIYNNIEK